MSTPSPSLLSRAYALADELASTENPKFVPPAPPPDSFMAHRPNRLLESYEHGQGVVDILDRWKAGSALQAAALLHSFVCKDALAESKWQKYAASAWHFCAGNTTIFCTRPQRANLGGIYTLSNGSSYTLRPTVIPPLFFWG